MEARQLQSMIDRKVSGSVIVIGGPGSGKTFLVNQCTQSCDKVIHIDGLLSIDFAMNLGLLFRHFLVESGGNGEMLTFEELSEALIIQHKQQLLPFTVIVVDHLERFVSGEHFASGQQLLYGLLELTAVLPVLLVGVTRRIDIVEGMEKRVRSRFSQNVIYVEGDDKRRSLLLASGFPTSIQTMWSDLAVPELLALLSVLRVLQKSAKLTMAAILNEYTNGVRHETDSTLMLSNTTAQMAAVGERQMLRAVESLIHRNLLRHARNDYWQHRQYRLLVCTVPVFALPEHILSAPNCPVPLRSLTMSICASQ